MADLTTIRYEQLFEVRILHEYYLNLSGAGSYFAADVAAREARLDFLLRNGKYDIRKDLFVEPSQKTSTLLEDHHLRFVRTQTGFIIAMKVKQESGTFSPFILPAPGTHLAFHLRINNPLIRNFTNLSLNSTLPSIYMFSNNNGEGTKVFPSLSLPIDQFRNGRTYEPGEVVMMGNDTLEALTRTSDTLAQHWRVITAPGIAHEGDRMLLPLQFRYRFPADTDVRQADFTLKTTDGTVIKTIRLSGVTKLETAMLDFRSGNPSTGPDNAPGECILEVTGDNGYNRSEKGFLSSELYDARDLGVVKIGFGTGDPAFGLLDPGGNIKANPPVFEVRLKSRITFWRYRSDSGKQLNTTVKTSPYLTAENGSLKSVRPLPMQSMPLEFTDEDPLIPAVFLPNPPPHALHVEPDGMIYSDLFTSGIKDLIEEI